MLIHKSARIYLLSVFTLSLLSACGGGTSSDSGLISPTTPTNVTWVAGTFAPENTFKDFCSNPRTGSDPFNQNQAYPDKQGTDLHEKMWLRSYSDNSYLWYSEIEDNDPNNFSISDYFNQLKTQENTDSGAKKDNFHFLENTADYNKQTQSGITSGYGIRWQFGTVKPPRKLTVAYTEPNSPAALRGIQRGAQVLEIDGVDFINSNDVDTINAGLSPTQNGQIHAFKLKNIDGSIISYNIESADINTSPVQNTKVIATNVGNVGYVQFNSHIPLAQEGLISAINQFSAQNVAEVVIDLRYNGGGALALASQFAYMISGDNATNNRTFETTVFNNKHTTNDPITGNTLRPTPFYDKKIDYVNNVLTSTNLPSLNMQRVFVLTTGSTCSASEAFMNGLRGIDIDVIQIGNTTCGKPYGFYPQDNCGSTYFTIQFKGINAKGFGDYSDGFVPKESPQFQSEVKGCDVADDFTKALGDPTEGLLSAALEYMKSESCPVIALSRSTIDKGLNKTQNTSKSIDNGLAIKVPNQIYNSIVFENKILSREAIK
ncbi:S41 family peptidase [Pseudoalteromonas denitrificans]|uniref:Peptidase family S41 n=1 Tax=Pseudoalteromonas denitrificans DSM 6059 TaxID=1123010 RepID=A0A1I1FBY7_9GAMM|nr:S41 family peptidase [Pseudoalteromonas denitrificans]SFB96804.1 Peptidase family S41 [Pseudoalteromonas denitrificans DSM 6059]